MSAKPARQGGPLFADFEKDRRRHDLKIRALKHQLAEWIEELQQPGNHGTITLAMLELGVERHLARFDEKSAADLLHGVLEKVIKRRRGPLQ